MYTDTRSDSIDNHNGNKLHTTTNKNENKSYKWDIVWINVFFLSALHLGAIYAMFLRCSYTAKWQSVVFGKLVAMCSGFGVTAGAHRLWCHKSYKANTFCQIILMLMVSTIYQNSIYVWCRDHRVHHKYSDTDADPHNSNRGFFFSHVGWLLVRKHKDVIEKGKSVDMSDLEANPIVMFQHKYYYTIVILCSFAIPVFIAWYIFNESFLLSLLSIGVYRTVMILNVTWCINSVAHKYGTKPYDKNIVPTENVVLQYIALGEGFHNYHHAFPWDYKTGEFGKNGRNAAQCLIDVFVYLGMASDRKTVTNNMIQEKVDKSGDAMLQNTSKNITKKFFNNTYIDDSINWFFFFLFYYIV